MAIKQDFNLSSGIGISADKAYLVNTTNSTSLTSGGLIVRGGAGIAKSLSLGGNLQLFNGSFYTSFVSSATANTIYVLPATSPAVGASVLQATSDGTMSWVPMVATGGASTGFTTLNSLTSGIQYFAVGSSGNQFNISSSGSTHTFNIPIAGSGSTGLITPLAQTIAGTKTFTSAIIGDLSGTATTSGFATTASYSFQSGYGLTSGFATTSSYSYQSGYGLTSGFATTSSYAYQSGYGLTSGFATTASYAYQSGYAITSGIATTAANINVVNATTNLAHPLIFGLSATGSGVALSSNTTLSYNPSTNILSTSGLAITATTLSTSSSTGALTVAGGVGIAGSSYFGNDLTVGNSQTGKLYFSQGTFGSAGTTINPSLMFVGKDNNPITLSVLSDNTLSFEGSSGQLFSINNNLSSGTIFSVNDISGIPIIRANANGTLSMGEFTGSVGVGLTNPSYKLHIAGDTNLSTGYVFRINGASVLSSSTLGTGVTNSSLTSVGTISTGVWAATAITAFYGGTGHQTYNTGDLLVGAGSTLYKLPVGTNNYALVADNSVPGGIKWSAVAGSAITNINGLTASRQDLAFGYSGSVPSFSSSGSTHTLNIPIAGTGATGLVSTQSQSFAGIKTFTNAVNITDSTGSGSYTAGALVVTGGVGIGGTLNVQGDLNVQGTFTTINSTTVTVADKNLELGVVTSPSDLTAQGGGITLKGATDKTINWYSGVGWSSSESWNLNSGNTYKIDNTSVLSSSSLGIGVTNSSLTALGTITTGTWAATAITTLYGGTGLVPSFVVGDILYANTTTTFGRLAASSNSGYVLSSAGSGSTPTYIAPSTLSVGFASTSTYSYQSGYAITSGLATTANYAIQSGYAITSGLATTSGFATTASYAYQSGYAITSGIATSSYSLFVNSANSNSAHSLLFAPISGSSSGSGVSINSVLNYNPSTNILYTSGLAITATTASTSTSNGALQVAGGVGISGRLSFNQASFGTTGITTNPTMAMIGQTGDPIFMSVLEDNTISFEGSQGQLFSITPNLSTGYIYSVNDITGIPLLRANANANVTANEYAGNFGIGLSNPGYKLHVIGSVGFTSNIPSTSTTSGTLVVAGGVGIGGSLYVASATAISGVTINNGVITGNLTGTATTATTSGFANTASYSYQAGYGLTSGFATTASYSYQSGYGLTSGFATTASYSHQAGYAITSDSSNTSGYATTSGFATTASYSYQSGYGLTSGFATTASYSYQSGYAITSGSSGTAVTANNINVVSAFTNSNHPILFTPSSGTLSGAAVSSEGSFVYNPFTDILSVSGLAVTAGTASTNVFTGALRVYGGLGVTGQLSFARASFGYTGINFNPSMSFIGNTSSSPISLTVLTDNSLSFEGSSGQLFAIDNNLSTGEIFSVSDISGLPIISASAGQTITLNEFGGYTRVGNGSLNSGSTTSGTFIVYGGVGITGNAFIGGTTNITNSSSSTSINSGALVVSGGVGIGGSLYVNSPSSVSSVIFNSGTVFGNLTGLATTASYAYTSGYGITSGFATTASYSYQSGYGLTSGFATTASYSYISGYGITSGLATTATYAHQAGYAITSDYSNTSGYATTSGLATTANYAHQSGYGLTSGFATTSSYSYQSGYGLTSGFATTAAYSYQAGYGITAGLATTANYSHQAGYAITSDSSNTSGYATTAGFATTSSYSYISGYGITAGLATTATYSHQSGYAITSGFATTGAYAYQSGYAITSGLATSSTSAFITNALSNAFHPVVFTPIVGSSSGAGLSSNSTLSYNPSTNYLYTSGLAITASTASTSVTTGALLVNGGVGISGNLSYNSALIGTTGIASQPQMTFIGANGDPIRLRVLDDSTLAFSGSQGQLFSISPVLNTGYIFSVNDISGVPLLRANADANVTMGEFAGNIGIGLSNPAYKLHVTGSVGFTSSASSTSSSTGALVVTGGVGIGQTLFTSSSYANSLSGVVLNNGVVTSGNWAGSLITGLYGGTGFNSYTKGDILVGAGTTLIKHALGNQNQILIADVFSGSGLSWATFASPTYGSFYSTSSQPVVGAGATTLATFNSTYESNRVSIIGGSGTSSRIQIQDSGPYSLTFSAQINLSTGNQPKVGDFWFRINGQDVPQSNTQMTITGKDYQTVITINFVYTFALNDYFEIAFSSDDPNFRIEALTGLTNPPRPDIPSIILSVLPVTHIVGESGSGISGILSLNGSTSSQQYFLTGTSGSGFNIQTASGNHTFNIPIASTGSTGLVNTLAQSFAGVKTFTNDVVVSSSTSSASSSTGALTVSGGVGISGSLNVGSATAISGVTINNGIITGNLTGTATTSTYAISSGLATTATYAHQSGYAITSGFASTASYAYQSGYGLTSGFATTASYSYTSGYGLTSGFADTSTYSYQSGYGITSGLATTATYSHQSGFAQTATSASTATTATNATNVILTADTTNATRRLIYSTNGVGSTSLYNTSTLFTNPSTSSIGASIFTGSGTVNIRPGIDATNGVSIGNSSGTPYVYFDTVNGRVGINQPTPLYDLHIVGELSATNKSFVIEHPTKPNMTLRHGSLEGPENGVYVRGKLENSNEIYLPDYWTGLVDEETITVSLVPIGRFSKLYVEKVEDYVVYIQDAESNAINCYFVVYGERKDIPKLDVEY